MKRLWYVFLAVTLLLSGCTVKEKAGGNNVDNPQESEGVTEISGKLPVYEGVLGSYSYSAPVGEVPVAFKKIVENNSFSYGQVWENCIVTNEYGDMDRTLRFYGYDGTLRLVHYVETGHLSLQALTVFDDGSFIYALCDPTHYNRYMNNRIVYCDSWGDIVWETPIDEAYCGLILYDLVVYKDSYYFVGEYFRDSSSSLSQSTRKDIWVLKYGFDGSFKEKAVFGSTGFDDFYNAELCDKGIAIGCRVPNADGDFTMTGIHTIVVDENLNTVSIENSEEMPKYYDAVGMLDGKAVYKSDFERIKIYDPAMGEMYTTVDTVVDYGDFYLTVFTHATKEYENTPMSVSAIWSYTETVYSAFTKEGKLIWSAAVDSSPDFEEWLKLYEKYN